MTACRGQGESCDDRWWCGTCRRRELAEEERAGQHFREARGKGVRAVTVHPAEREVFGEFEKRYAVKK